MALSFDHLGIITRSAQENADMAAFFAQVLDLLVEGDAADGYAEVHAGAMTIALHHGAMIGDIAPLGGTLLQFRCSDVDAETAAVRSRGGAISLEPTDTDWGTRSAYISGPHGLLVELYAWR